MAMLLDLRQQTLLILGFEFLNFSKEIDFRFIQTLNFCTLGLKMEVKQSPLKAL